MKRHRIPRAIAVVIYFISALVALFSTMLLAWSLYEMVKFRHVDQNTWSIAKQSFLFCVYLDFFCVFGILLSSVAIALFDLVDDSAAQIDNQQRISKNLETLAVLLQVIKDQGTTRIHAVIPPDGQPAIVEQRRAEATPPPRPAPMPISSPKTYSEADLKQVAAEIEAEERKRFDQGR